VPKLGRDISSVTQFQRTSDENGLADTQTRIFRVLLNDPGEQFDIQDECSVKIGDAHPVNTNVFCRSFSANFEGDSRMVVLCTFQYQTLSGSGGSGSGGTDPGSQAPDIRIMDIATSVSLMEKPVYYWKPLGGAPNADNWVEPVNPAGDIYDGLSKLEPAVNITISGYEATDPLRHCTKAGMVNDEVLQIGSLFCPIRTVMFRGVSCQPTVESWGDNTFRGWRATYEFTYRSNWTRIGGAAEIPIGWDIVVPQSGFNVKAFAPPGGGDVDTYGQPYRHSAGKIISALVLPETVNPGDKVRGMLRVHSYDDGGVSQTPSAQPIPLNNNGNPRSDTADPKVLAYRYQIYEELDFMTTFGLRLPPPP
jgi:hypothetical protein